ncbi:MAG TPA: hypothetical protein VFE14_02865 [Micromonosporaceae bacterium]|nr:hypothetical protein [Micromonosporaceae bacterium]
MTDDMETRLAAAMRLRAEHEVDAYSLLDGALTRGRERARRRQLGTAFGAAGVAAATAAVLAASSLGLGGGSAQPGASGSAVDTDLARGASAPTGSPPVRGSYPLPAVPARSGTQGAAARPDLVGTDPTTLHFGVRPLALPVAGAQWQVMDAVESVDFAMTSGTGAPGHVSVSVARGAAPDPVRSAAMATSTPRSIDRPVQVGGRTATLTITTSGEYVERIVRWAPVDGVGAVVNAVMVSESELLEVAGAVRFDSASGCRVPVRLGALPAGAHLAECSMFLPGVAGQPVTSSVVLTGPGGAVSVQTDAPVAAPQPTASTVPTPLAHGLGGAWMDGGDYLIVSGVDRVWVSVSAAGSYGRDAIGLVAGGLAAAGDPANPGSWPVDPTK